MIFSLGAQIFFSYLLLLAFIQRYVASWQIFFWAFVLIIVSGRFAVRHLLSHRLLVNFVDCLI